MFVNVTTDWTIDRRLKSFPPSADGLPAAAIASAGWRLHRDFATPIAVLRESALAHNLDRMRSYCADNGVRHAPHGKTTMSPELITRQLDHGAWGMTAATAWQAQAMIGFGARRVIVASECLDPVGLRWIAQQLEADPTLEVLVFVDSVAAIDQMCRILRDADASRRLPVLVEVGVPGGRAGARTAADAADVGRAVAAAPELELAGVAGFEGAVKGTREPSTLAGVRAFVATIRRTALELMADKAFRPDHRVVLSAGGSMFVDLVVADLVGTYPEAVEVVIRSGCYLTHDHGVYQANSPLPDEGPDFEPALEVWSRVLSTPEAGLAIIDAGRRDVASDAGLPRILRRLRDGEPEDVADARLTGFNDQHGFVDIAEPGALRVGDLVALGVSHPCTTLDKWRALPVVDDDYRVLAAVRTYF